VEKIQRDVSHSHRLVPGPELEEKALVLKQLGETLTELKGKSEATRGCSMARGQCESSAVLPPSPHAPPVLSVPSRPAHSFLSLQLTFQACRARCG
jgi:hypothetical protein